MGSLILDRYILCQFLNDSPVEMTHLSRRRNVTLLLFRVSECESFLCTYRNLQVVSMDFPLGIIA
jgi:hypothetical protein